MKFATPLDFQLISLKLAPVIFILFLFFLPISTTLKSIFLISGLVLALLSTEYRNEIIHAFSTWWGCAAFALFSFMLLSCLWSPAPYAMQLALVDKYCRLLYLPVFAVIFAHPKTRSYGIHAYLAALFITCIISFVKTGSAYAGYDAGHVFNNHIITGFMMSFAAYLAALLAFQNHSWHRLAYSVLVLMMSYQVLFINTGRTGYIVYFILMLLLILQKLSLRKALLGVLISIVASILLYSQSNVMHRGVDQLIQEVQTLQARQNTSLGYRVQFHNYAQSLFLSQFIHGVGAGGFKYRFFLDNPVPSWKNILNEPHSQYWLILAEQGLIGFTLFLCFLGSLALSSFKLKETRPIFWGIFLVFLAGCFTDSIFTFSALGYLFIAMSGLCLGEVIEQTHQDQTCLSDNCNEHSSDIEPSLHTTKPEAL